MTLASGTLALSGSDNYSGGTYVEGGMLIVAADNALLDGSSLFVGADAASIFGPLEAANSDFAAETPLSAAPVKAVPEPPALALLIAAAIAVAVGSVVIMPRMAGVFREDGERGLRGTASLPLRRRHGLAALRRFLKR